MKKYDLIVTGGGALGTFHAYHALTSGKSVLLFEKDNYPVGATVRNFGQVVPSGMAGEWFEYGRRGLEIYKSIQQLFDISARNNGSVYIASDADEQQLLHELKAHYDTKNYPCELLSKEALLAKYPAIKPSYAWEGLFFPEEISVEPALMIHRLQQYMREKFPALTIRYNSPVIDCRDEQEGVSVMTSSQERFFAAKAIICNGLEFKLLFPEVYRSSGQVVSKLQMLRTVPMPEVQLEGNILTGLSIRRYESFEAYCPSFKNISTPDHYKELKQWGVHILFKKAADGSFIIGDSHEYAGVEHADDLGFGISESINKLMLDEAARIVNFDVYKVASSWAGFYPQHPDNIMEKDISKNIHIRTGIGGKGMTASIGYTEQSIRKIFA